MVKLCCYTCSNLLETMLLEHELTTTPIPSPSTHLRESSTLLLQFLDGGVGNLCQLGSVSHHLDAEKRKVQRLIFSVYKNLMNRVEMY